MKKFRPKPYQKEKRMKEKKMRKILSNLLIVANQTNTKSSMFNSPDFNTLEKTFQYRHPNFPVHDSLQ